MQRDEIPDIKIYPDGQTLPTPESAGPKPGTLLGCVSGELGTFSGIHVTPVLVACSPPPSPILVLLSYSSSSNLKVVRKGVQEQPTVLRAPSSGRGEILPNQHSRSSPLLPTSAGLRSFLEDRGHTLVVVNDKDSAGGAFEQELHDTDIVISQPFW
jgi:hypothetical protein